MRQALAAWRSRGPYGLGPAGACGWGAPGRMRLGTAGLTQLGGCGRMRLGTAGCMRWGPRAARELDAARDSESPVGAASRIALRFAVGTGGVEDLANYRRREASPHQAKPKYNCIGLAAPFQVPHGES